MSAASPLVVGSYPPEDVTFLLKDLSSVALERQPAERERLLQGDGHYSESLPVEYRPTDAYRELFLQLLTAGAREVAAHVVALAELLLERRGRELVLVSLARAGTPVGVLLRRALAALHGIDVPHYTVSIIRDRGIDRRALEHVLARHPPAAVQFVDGWTGKGAITRELVRALDGFVPRLDPTLAVLADPGACSTLFATRDDLLVPSACLNSTVCGLISRTVLNRRWIGEADFHGAKVYAELKADDLSRHFVDTIASRFGSVGAEAAELRARAALAPPPDDRGLAVARSIAAEHGITDLNLVKPGIGESTRVLLRRVPDVLLVDPGAGADLRHLRFLARDRGVPVRERPGMGFAACGIIASARRPA